MRYIKTSKSDLLRNIPESRIIACFIVVLLISLFWGCNSSPSSDFLFTPVSEGHSKIKFRNVIPEDKLTNSFFYEYVYNGGGVAVGDLNNDGLADLYFTSNLHSNALYLNQGELEFIDVTEAADMGGNKGWTTGVNMVDINNDGLLDIYICKSGPYDRKSYLKNELYVNLGPDENGIPKFKESAADYGLDVAIYSIQSAFLDFDLDGDLDMYLMNHNPQTIAIGNPNETSPLGDKFYINNDGRFVDATSEVGIISNAVAYGLGIGVSDLNHDGWPDLYVSNDYDEPDYMYINNQGKGFDEVVKKATKHISNFAMGNDIADLDNDGYFDILTLDMVSEDNYGQKTSMASMNPRKFEGMVNAGKHYQYMYNTLQKHTSHTDHNGVPYFSEVGQFAGISNTDWSWAPLIADYDNDGLKDIFISNGIKRDFRNKDFYNYLQEYKQSNADALTNGEKVIALVEKSPKRPSVNYFFRNTGSFAFDDQSKKWLENPKASFSNGAAYADLDNDGDLDLIINNVDEPASILQNNSDLTNSNYLRIAFEGSKNNINGIGTTIKVYTSNGTQFFENYAVRGYQSSVQPGIHVGLGELTGVDSILITWPGAKSQVIYPVEVNREVTVKYSDAGERTLERSKNSSTFFATSTTISGVQHIENDYDDYQNQVLLPHKMSQFGPAIAVGDVNGDGRDDMYLGQSKGGASLVYLQNSDGTFMVSQTFEADKDHEDVDAAFFDMDNDGDLDLYVASGGNEQEANHELYRDRLYENIDGRFIKRSDRLPNIPPISSSRVRVFDYDGDGYNDIFVGGRHVPHEYPSPASSLLLHNDKGVFKDVSQSAAPDLENIGLVTDATWLDYDGDDDVDLCIVGEWMQPVFLSNENGRFTRMKEDSMNLLTGWYFATTAMDVDADGDQDIILGNLGRNYKYKGNEEEPFEVYYSDFDGNGSNDLVLGYHNFGELYPVRGRECSSQQMPDIKKIAPTYHDFGSASLSDIYGEEKLDNALHLASYNFKSGVLRNDGGGQFVFVPFPDEAQVSSINSFLTHDVNADGLEDIILAGNLYVSEIETPRADASYGLVLLNGGDGNFDAIDSNESGLFLNGDIKSMRFLKGDKQLSLIAGSNNGPVFITEVLSQNLQ